MPNGQPGQRLFIGRCPLYFVKADRELTRLIVEVLHEIQGEVHWHSLLTTLNFWSILGAIGAVGEIGKIAKRATNPIDATNANSKCKIENLVERGVWQWSVGEFPRRKGGAHDVV